MSTICPNKTINRPIGGEGEEFVMTGCRYFNRKLLYTARSSITCFGDMVNSVRVDNHSTFRFTSVVRFEIEDCAALLHNLKFNIKTRHIQQPLPAPSLQEALIHLYVVVVCSKLRESKEIRVLQQSIANLQDQGQTHISRTSNTPIKRHIQIKCALLSS